MNPVIAQGIDACVAAMNAAEMPVLARTVREIGKLRQREDEVTPREISAVVLRDPLLTVKVLRHIEAHRRPGQPADITTIEHALMMMGASPFFRAFERMTTVEKVLARKPHALAGFPKVAIRARDAAAYAQNWAAYRHDLESDEVTIAALLHDLAELLLWCFAPNEAVEISSLMAQEAGLRSADAQQRVLGFKLHDMQLALCDAWKLPGLLRDLMDDKHAEAPRVKNVVLAVALARHSAHGWDDAALPDDYTAIAKFLKIPHGEVCEKIVRTARNAGKSDSWYGAPGTATALPAPVLLEIPDPPRGIAAALERAEEKLTAEMLMLLPLGHAHQDVDEIDSTHALISHAVTLIHDLLGFPRAMFAAAAPASANAGARLTAVASAGKDSSTLAHFALPLDEISLFSRLVDTGGTIWLSEANRDTLRILLTEAMTAQIGHGEFVAKALHADGKVIGILYADRGAGSAGIDLAGSQAFQHLGEFLGTCLDRVHTARASHRTDVLGASTQALLPLQEPS